MKNKFIVAIVSVLMGLSPIVGYAQSQNAGSEAAAVSTNTATAAGGMSVGTAIGLGLVGAALLIAVSGESSAAAVAGGSSVDDGSTHGGSTPTPTDPPFSLLST